MSSKRPSHEPSLQKELAETKRENHKLKRQLAKLQKRLVKLLESGPTEGYKEDDIATETTTPLDSTGVQCPECESPLSAVRFGLKTLRVCKSCKYRKVD